MEKDLFSGQASAYARYRPGYPSSLFEYIVSFVKDKQRAWDCATGNGQAAQSLASYFQRVDATDISEAQLAKAVPAQNIFYGQASAERTLFADNSFDLITVATAYHWLNWKRFHDEAVRVGKNGCVVAAWAYNILHTEDAAINELILHFYRDITGPYWDAERKYVDDNYQTVEFRFEQLPEPGFEMQLQWNREQFTGYLSSWSSVQHFIDRNGHSPLSLIEERLQELWPGEKTMTVTFPLFMRIGRILK
jgi:ubiquinone/menaquinone biosynthesis C-methylase UbiE